MMMERAWFMLENAKDVCEMVPNSISPAKYLWNIATHVYAQYRLCLRTQRTSAKWYQTLSLRKSTCEAETHTHMLSTIYAWERKGRLWIGTKLYLSGKVPVQHSHTRIRSVPFMLENAKDVCKMVPNSISPAKYLWNIATHVYAQYRLCLRTQRTSVNWYQTLSLRQSTCET